MLDRFYVAPDDPLAVSLLGRLCSPIASGRPGAGTAVPILSEQ